MSIAEFDAAVAAATGDTIGTIRRRGFSMSQLSLLKAHETLVPSVGRFQSADRIIGHNHPSGDILPSSQDRAVTRSLANAGKVLGVPLHDHLIIGMNGKRFSFAEPLPEDLRAS